MQAILLVQFAFKLKRLRQEAMAVAINDSRVVRGVLYAKRDMTCHLLVLF